MSTSPDGCLLRIGLISDLQYGDMEDMVVPFKSYPCVRCYREPASILRQTVQALNDVETDYDILLGDVTARRAEKTALEHISHRLYPQTPKQSTRWH